MMLAKLGLIRIDLEKTHLSDLAIPLQNEDLKNKTVAVVDDVLIYGDTLLHLKNTLDQIGCKVIMYAIAMNNESDLDRERFSSAGEAHRQELAALKSDTIHFFSCTQYRWKQTSDRIMRILWKAAAPYIADMPFINVIGVNCIGHMSTMEKRGMIEEYVCIEGLDWSIKRMGSRLLHIIRNEEYAISHLVTSIINNDVGHQVFIPSVFLPQGALENDRAIIRFYKRAFDDQYDSVAKIMRIEEMYSGDNRDSLMPVNTRFLTFLLGCGILLAFDQHYGILGEDKMLDITNLRYSFDARLVPVFQGLFESRRNEFIEAVDDFLKVGLQEHGQSKWKVEEDLYTSFDSVKADCDNEAHLASHPIPEANQLLLDDYYDIVAGAGEIIAEKDNQNDCEKLERRTNKMLRRYFKLNNLRDKRLMTEEGKRLVDIPANVLLDKTASLIKNLNIGSAIPLKDISMASLMNLIYLGFATFDYRMENGTCSCFVHAGEQSYKCVIREYVPTVYFLHRYEERYQKDMYDFLKNILIDMNLKISKFCGKRGDKKEFERYCSGADESIYDLEDMIEYYNDAIERRSMQQILSIDFGYLLQLFAEKYNGELADAGREFGKFLEDKAKKVPETRVFSEIYASEWGHNPKF